MNARTLLGLTALLAALTFGPAGPAADVPPTRPVSAAVLNTILAAPNALPVAGKAHAEITLVEFFDYNCPYCRKLDPELRELLATDPNVRVVQKDFPVFGDVSVYAAYCAFAAARQGQYAKAHAALIDSKRNLNSKGNVDAVLKDAGFDLAKIQADLNKHGEEYAAMLASNRQETALLGVRGTPVLIVGTKLVINTPDIEQLRALVAAARAAH